MAHTDTHASHHPSTVRLLGLVLKTTAIAGRQTWKRTVSRRPTIGNFVFTADQLRDIGHAEASAPVLEVKAGLVTNLISMR